MSSLCIIDISIKWILMFFLHCNQFDQNRTIYVCFSMLHILLLAVLSEKLCMFLYNLTVVTSQKLTVKAKNTMIFPKNSLKVISSKFSRFWLTTYLLGVFFRQFEFLCASTVLPFRQFRIFFVRRRHQEKNNRS
jgi:hypothetical protein